MQQIRFLHIPKTAGLTLWQVLLRQYHRRKYFAFTGNKMGNTSTDIERYKNLSDQERQEITLFLGHAPLTTGIEDADKAIILTLLRNPISRVKSLCQYVSEGNWGDYYPAETFDLDHFLNSGDNQLCNHQTKFLINSGSDGSPDLINSISPSDAKDLALDRLFNVVSRFGLQEKFDESLILFAQFLNWRTPFYVSVNRKNPTRLIAFKKQHLDHIAELNAIDIEVYKTAKKTFNHIIASKDYDTAKLRRFRSLNQYISPLLKVRMQIGKRIGAIWQPSN